VLAALPSLAGVQQVAIAGVFDPGSADIAGTMTSPTPALLSEAIDDFYAKQVTIAQEDIAEVSALTPADSAEAEAHQQFLREHSVFVGALQAREPFVTGIGATMTPASLLATLLNPATSSLIKAVQVLPAAGGLLSPSLAALSGAKANAATTREAQRRGAAARAGATSADPGPYPRCYEQGGRGPLNLVQLDPTPTYWAPSRDSYNTSLGDEDGDHHLKVHRLRWRWTKAESLAWMCADVPGDHNVEIEAAVFPTDGDRWSDNWESNSARKYTQHNGPAGGNIHQDDLADGDSPLDAGYPFDKQKYPDFAILFQSSQEFRYGRLYKVRFVTNEGFTDTGRVIYSQQATHHVATKLRTATACRGPRTTSRACSAPRRCASIMP